MATRTIEVGTLARVEGEGSLSLTIRDGLVEEARLSIFEPPRFFERVLVGRRAGEAVDITARICGICPVAYQMTAVHAMERAAGITVEGPLRDLRRLLYCGEWIESHALHIFMLHAPDFLGFDDAVAMAREHRDIVEAGLRIKKAGNAIVAALGGREVHPINVRLGGFYRVPQKAELAALYDPLRAARDEMLEFVSWAAGLEFPDVDVDYDFVALRHQSEYPMNQGRIVSSSGLNADAAVFETLIEETQLPYSTALRSEFKKGGAYLVGPLARFSLNRDRLTPLAAEAADAGGLGEVCRNPFKSLLVRGVEVILAFEEALRLIEAYEVPDHDAVPFEIGAATGHAATEAPRGLLYHRYEIGTDDRIVSAKIVPPTSQNQGMIEADLKTVAQRYVELPDDELQWRCEQTVRNYDPCISCATHFLKLDIDRQDENKA